MLDLLQQRGRAALRRSTTIGLHRHKNYRLSWGDTAHPMQHQDRPRLVLLLQTLCHGCDLTFAKAGEMLQLQRLQRPAIHCGGTHPTDEDRRSRGIPAPKRKLLPRIKGIRAHLHMATAQTSTASERWKKGQLISGLQRLIRNDQLLVDRNVNALERAKIQLVPDLTGRRDHWRERERTFCPTGAFTQGSKQQHLQQRVYGS